MSATLDPMTDNEFHEATSSVATEEVGTTEIDAAGLHAELVPFNPVPEYEDPHAVVPQIPATAAAKEREEILEGFYPSRLRLENVDWVVFGWMALMHIGALAAPFYFTWQAAVVALALHWFTCSIGICMCYHRTLSHRSLILHGPAKLIGMIAGGVAGEGPPLTWTAVHRVHHARSDRAGDPHSPLEGPWWSHLLWLMLKRTDRMTMLIEKHYVPDLAKDKMVQFFEKTAVLWLIGPSVAAFAAGYFLMGGLTGGLSMLLWAGCMRMVVAYHSTWFVNSATHLWGYRNYETADESRNLWWVAVLSYGEGWHNNHHAYPRVARAGHRWWEIDPTWYAIKFLRLIGLATQVDDKLPEVKQTQSKAA
ncbi:MAG: fatty acid desaturase [Planctomycetaceae bacterium]